MTMPSSFDDQIIRKLADILNETHLTEIEYEVGETRVRVSRQLSGAAHFQVPHFSSQSSELTHPAAPLTGGQALSDSAQKETAKPLDWSQHPGVIKAPMVGTVYASATPGSEPFVSAGTQVTKGQTLVIIEAMKVMNQIKAPRDGQVIEILFHDGELVEYDHPLLVLE